MFLNEIRIPWQLPCFLLLNYGTGVIDWNCKRELRGGKKRRMRIISPSTPPALSRPEGRRRWVALILAATSLRHIVKAHSLKRPPQNGRRSVECASVGLLCGRRLVVGDLSAALMCVSLNPTSFNACLCILSLGWPHNTSYGLDSVQPLRP